MGAIRFWILFFVSSGFLIGFSHPVYAASFLVEQIVDKSVQGNALMSGEIEKFEQDNIVVNGKRYRLSAEYKVFKNKSSFMDDDVQPFLSKGLLVEFIPKGNLIETITIVVPE